MTAPALEVQAPTSIRIPLRDGAELSADHYSAGTGTPAPSVVMFTPYLKGDMIPVILPIAALNDAGIDVLTVDIRGTGQSDGIFPGPLSPREVADGAEVVEWVADQPWSTGRVGLGGGSYPGGIQLLIAARRPRGLACIAPAVAPIDFYRDWTHRGGIPSHSNWASATFLQTPQPERSVTPALQYYYGTAQALPEDGPAFWERSPVTQLSNIEVPILFIGGLYDYFARGTLRGFDAAVAPKRLVFGPWGHQYPEDPTEILDWFRYWLLDEGANPVDEHNVVFWRIGTDTWHRSTGREIPQGPTVVSLGSSRLPVRATQNGWPQEKTPSPLPEFMDTGTPSGMHLWGEDHVLSLGHVRGDIQGAPVLRFNLADNGCADADIYARLSYVHSDGRVEQLTEGRLRLSHRAVDPEKSRRYPDGSYESVQLTHVNPQQLNGAAEAFIEMLPTSVKLKDGDQLRLGMSARRVDGTSRAAELHIERLDVLLPVLDATESAQQ